MSYLQPNFSVNRYDLDGDIYEDGIFLYFDHTSIRICDADKKSLCDFIKELEEIRDEILPLLIE